MNVTLTRNRKVAVAGVLVVLAIGAVVAYPIFAPKPTTQVNEAAMAGAQTLAQGTFQGAGDGIHQASGRVLLQRDGGSYYLRFEDYEATSGPDVFFYLTSTADARTTQQVESGLRVLVPGGSDGGEATLRGSFNVPLPADFDPARYRGLAIWCDQFDTLFGSAALA